MQKKVILSLIVSMSTISICFAQQKVSVTVAAEGGDYTTIKAAILGVFATTATLTPNALKQGLYHVKVGSYAQKLRIE